MLQRRCTYPSKSEFFRTETAAEHNFSMTWRGFGRTSNGVEH